MTTLHLAELLCSRLCHDLVSPLGAIQNGLELIEDVGPDVLEDALGLMGQSSRRASAVLQAFRMAFGRAGDDPGLRFEAMRDLTVAYFADTRITPAWSIDHNDPTPPVGYPRAALMLAMVGPDLLPVGGNLTIHCAAGAAPISLVADGRDAQVPDAVAAGLTRDLAPDDVTPRTVHLYFLGHWLRDHGLHAEATLTGPEQVRLTVQASAGLSSR